jgi:small subunit ribosomal protein S17
LTSDARDKTITVTVERAVRHPLYGRVVRRSKKLMAHDEGREAHNGDLVEIMETRPLSKTKRWRLIKILERAK